MKFRITVNRAERGSTPGIVEITYGSVVAGLASVGFTHGGRGAEHEAADFAGVRSKCEEAARAGLAMGWPGAFASAEPVGPRKPNGWDAHRDDRRVFLFADEVAP